MKIIPYVYSANIPLGTEVEGIGPFQTSISTGVQAGLGVFLSNIITTVTVVGSLAFVIFFTLGGLKWITAGGDKAKVSESQTQMTQAAIGLIAIVSSFFIIGIVGAVLGLDILNPFTMLNL